MITNTYNFCELCGHISYDPKDFVSVEEPQCICVYTDACARRQKRNAVLAEMQEMARKPYAPVHPVDKFSKIALGICAGFLMSVILACVLFLIGL